MAENTKIEWTDATWNPLAGCSRASEGCRNCYAEIMAARFSDPGQWGHGIARRVKLADGTTDHRWTGTVKLVEARLDQPLRWRTPRMIFVDSTSDLFHESVPYEWIDRVFAVMALASHHTYQILTKRAARMREYLAGRGRADAVARAGLPAGYRPPGRITISTALRVIASRTAAWPLPNVWLGTSTEDQATADERIPHLLATPAAVRFISAEPLLGPVDLTRWSGIEGDGGTMGFGLDWVIVGGESGPGARVWDGFEDAARSLRDQCAEAGVAFFMKQMAGARKSAMPPIPADLMIRQMPGGV